jgi:hypothetical protein
MLNRTFSELKQNVGKNAQDTSTQSLTLWGTYLNEAYSEYFKRVQTANVREDYSLAVTVGTQDYTLPDDFGKEIYAVDSTSGEYLERTTIQKFAIDNPSLINQSGDTKYYTILTGSVRNQPAAASTLSIVSSSTADTSQTVYIRGLNGTTEVTESVTLNGTAAVVTTNSFTNISKITKQSSSGYVTITAGAVTVAVIGARAVDYIVKIFRLLQSPANASTVYIPYSRELLPMTDDSDCPEADCGEFLIAKATAKAWRFKRQFAKGQYYDTEAEKYLDNLVWAEANQPNSSNFLNVVPYSRES